MLAERISTPAEADASQTAQPYRCEDKFPWYSATDTKERCLDWTGPGCNVPNATMQWPMAEDIDKMPGTNWAVPMCYRAGPNGCESSEKCLSEWCPNAPNPVGSLVECWKPTKPRSASDPEQNVVVSDAGVTQTGKFAKTYKCANEGCYKIIDPALELQWEAARSQGMITTGAVCAGLLILLGAAYAVYRFKFRKKGT